MTAEIQVYIFLRGVSVNGHLIQYLSPQLQIDREVVLYEIIMAENFTRVWDVVSSLLRAAEEL